MENMNDGKMTIHNLDCFDFFENYKGDKIDLVLVDLPYGQTDCKWDVKIDLKLMWKKLKKICSLNCVYVFFTTTKFGNDLINSDPNYFRYDMVWEKTNSVGFLCAKTNPLRLHEMIYIFGKNSSNDTKRESNLDLREYSKKLFIWINKPYKEIEKGCGNMGLSHFYCHKGEQFGIPRKINYDFLISKYNIDKFEYYLTHEEIKILWKRHKNNRKIYNPQMGKGKAYNTMMKKDKDQPDTLYGNIKESGSINKGTRYPTSILKYPTDKEKLHPTQKPVALCEWLVKTYTNENDLVLDFCMGSGSVGVACNKTGRRFIGVEKDAEIYKTACARLVVDPAV